MTNSLLGCPFCDGKPYVENFYDKTLFAITCLKCKATTDWYTSYEAAAAAWNTRVEQTCHIVKASRKYILSDGTELFEDGCSECNSYLGDGDNYCSNCGAKVVE